MHLPRLFVAGSTGATGKALIALAQKRERAVVAHVRPKSAASAPAGSTVVDLEDEVALAAAMKGCTAVVQLIGTMKKRFASGDTYESADVGTTQRLVDAAKRAYVNARR